MSVRGIEDISTMRGFFVFIFYTIVSIYDHVFLKLDPGQVGRPETVDDLIWRCCYALYSLCCTVSLCLSISCGVLMCFFAVLLSFYVHRVYRCLFVHEGQRSIPVSSFIAVYLVF